MTGATPMIRTLALLLTLSALTACHIDYLVEIKNDGDRLLRRTTVDADLEPGEITALKDAYGQPEPDAAHHTSSEGDQHPPTKLLFHGIDSGIGWPDGFGGLGSWNTYESPLGSATCFLECLGGDVTALADMLAIQDGIDAVASRIKRQLREGMKGHRMLPRILRLIDDRLVPDSHDAIVLGWALLFSYKALPGKDLTGGGPGHDRLSGYLESRIQEAVVAFLWQRGWLTAGESSLLASQAADINSFAKRIVARALDLNMSGDWMEQLEELEDAVSACFTEDFNEVLKADFAKAVDGHPRLAVAWAATSSILTSREVTVRLEAAEKPATTNGEWDSERTFVEWTLDTAPLAVGLTAPPLCWSATWAQPDAAAQQRVLGHVGIEGEALVAFCLAWSEARDDQREAALDIIESFAHARHGTDIKADSASLLGECRRALDYD